jgi:lipopolysaccharide biosynthesis protein
LGFLKRVHKSLKARAIAFYLPQFHPIPENDEWWGKGFTEWTNVAKARPFFKGHRQPTLPADLGFYDLRLPEVQDAQAALAQAHGIEGFCYWHYWFSGKRLLEAPVNVLLRRGRPDFPFCVAWANESWSRRWLGEEKEILIQQSYSLEDDQVHAEWLVKLFYDKRYIRVNGRPLFLIYKPSALPDAKATTAIIRKVCLAAGLPNPYLVGINAHVRHLDMRTLGFDGTEDHFPQLGALPDAFYDHFSKRRLLRNLQYRKWSGTSKIYAYDEAVALMEAGRPAYPHHPAVFVGWDNTARRGDKAIVITGSKPEKVAAAIRPVIDRLQSQPFEERLLFINAWNEWAEGMYLEPDDRYGSDLLKAIRSVLVNID